MDSAHALRPDELRALELADLDLTRARLTVRRAARTHVIYLDELTLGCADAWLRDRHGRWPRTTARHTADPVRLMRLFGISDATAMRYVFTAHPERQSVLPR